MPAAILYTKPVALDAQRHADLRLIGQSDLRFARPTNAIPVNLVEFALAAKSYPIAFIYDDEPIPVAIVGLEADNLFIDDRGQWKSGAYVPAWVRQYPFILGSAQVDEELKLCVEYSPEIVSTTSGEALFDRGAPSAAYRKAMDFCRAYHAASKATRAFTDAIAAAGLLVERRADAKLKSGGVAALTKFKAIDLDRLQTLPARVLGQWNERQWLAPLYAIVQSANNWTDLGELLATRKAAA